MTTFVALLRGINVGGHHKVPMAELRALCESTGLRDVRSYIQSGNLVFACAGKAPAVAKKLEAAIASRFGFAIDVIVRAASQWPVYVQGNPLREASARAPNLVMLGLSKLPPNKGALAALRQRAAANERIEAVGDALWFHFADGVGKSRLSSALIDRAVGSTVTVRNWRTVLELQKLLGGDAAP